VVYEDASILRRDGNWAVVQLPGRRFPGIHIQADTFAALREQLARAGRALRDGPSESEALDELRGVVEEMDAMLRFYEQVLLEEGIRRPY
jgi:hypothetical protein